MNALSSEVQKNVEESIDDPEAKELFKFSTLITNMTGKEKPHELPLALKLKTEGDRAPSSIKTNNVNFE
jgi:hypothetical protein